MSDSISEAFDKRFGTQSVSGVEYGMKNRLDLFHAFVVEQFGEQEIYSSDISSRMKKILKVRIADYFGCQLNHIVDTDELNKLFHVQKVCDRSVV